MERCYIPYQMYAIKLTISYSLPVANDIKRPVNIVTRHPHIEAYIKDTR